MSGSGVFSTIARALPDALPDTLLDAFATLGIGKSTRFTHAPLDTTCKQIRLCQIWPGNDEEPALLIRHFEFDEAVRVEFHALSYCWGPARPTHRIRVNGKHFWIRQNLYDYLIASRKLKNHMRWLWMDQLCINQEDVTERNHQVGMMSDIYKTAQGVTVWLGRPADQATAALAVQFLYDLYSKDAPIAQYLVEDHGEDISFRELPMLVLRTKRFPDDNVLVKKPRTALRDDVRLAMDDILKNPYWHRLWIVSEILLSARIVVQWGESIAPWAALQAFTEYTPGWKDVAPIPSIIRHSRQAWVSNARRYKLSWLVQNFSSHECENSRDKIYGILPTAKDQDAIEIDYSKQAQAVFLDAASAILNEWSPHATGELHEWRRVLRVCFDLRTVMLLPELKQHKVTVKNFDSDRDTLSPVGSVARTAHLAILFDLTGD